MTFSKFFLLLILSLGFISCSSNSGGSKRLLVEHDPCHEDNKAFVPLEPNQKQNFYNVLAPVAHLDRAFDLAPKKDDQKAKIPKPQGKIISDIRELCLINISDLGQDYQYQTFKGNKSITSGKAENIICPVKLTQAVTPDKTTPAFADPVSKEVKSLLESLKWEKLTPDYKELGLVQAVEMSGEAKTEWLRNPSQQINVSEKYKLKIDFVITENEKAKEPLIGEYNVCRKYFSIQNAKYELVVKRIQFTLDSIPMQGKYLSFTKYEQDQTTLEWKIARDPREDFYLNNVLVPPAEIDGLETKRKGIL